MVEDDALIEDIFVDGVWHWQQQIDNLQGEKTEDHFKLYLKYDNLL